MLSGAEFELKKNNVAVTATPQITGANGELTFEGLTEGIYVLKEVKAPNGYKKNDTEYVIKIEKVGNNFIKTLDKDYADAILTDASGDLTVINVPLPSSGNGGGGGVGGGGTPPVTNTEEPTKPTKPEDPTKPTKPEDPTKPTKPEEPTKSTKPIKPTKPDNPEDPDVPEVPDMPEEPETPDTTPTTPSYPINRTPDPNDPNSPDEITVIGDDGAPLGKYVKKQKPNGEFEYISVDDGTPLGGHKVPTLPKTGGAGNAWYYAVGAGLVLGAGLMFKKRDEEEQES